MQGSLTYGNRSTLSVEGRSGNAGLKSNLNQKEADIEWLDENHEE
jgi:hypothetical protein